MEHGTLQTTEYTETVSFPTLVVMHVREQGVIERLEIYFSGYGTVKYSFRTKKFNENYKLDEGGYSNVKIRKIFLR